MIIQIDKDLLFNTFKIDCFSKLEDSASMMAPSLVEYYLHDFTTINGEISYINKTNIQQSIYLDEYNLYLDYSEDIFMEFIEKEDQYETESLW